MHVNIAHSDKTRVKPRVPVKSSRKLVSVVPMQPSSQAPSFPALTNDADSELLLDEAEDTDVDILENDQTPVGNLSVQPIVDVPAQRLEVQKVSTTMCADIPGPPSKGMEAIEGGPSPESEPVAQSSTVAGGQSVSSQGMEEQEVSSKSADPPLARPEDSSKASNEVV